MGQLNILVQQYGAKRLVALERTDAVADKISCRLALSFQGHTAFHAIKLTYRCIWRDLQTDHCRKRMFSISQQAAVIWSWNASQAQMGQAYAKR